LGGHNFLKQCPKEAYEVFFNIYRKHRCQKYLTGKLICERRAKSEERRSESREHKID
jgi:hypothetical protein